MQRPHPRSWSYSHHKPGTPCWVSMRLTPHCPAMLPDLSHNTLSSLPIVSDLLHDTLFSLLNWLLLTHFSLVKIRAKPAKKPLTAPPSPCQSGLGVFSEPKQPLKVPYHRMNHTVSSSLIYFICLSYWTEKT